MYMSSAILGGLQRPGALASFETSRSVDFVRGSHITAVQEIDDVPASRSTRRSPNRYNYEGARFSSVLAVQVKMLTPVAFERAW